MKTKRFLLGVLALAITASLSLAGCSDTPGGGSGTTGGNDAPAATDTGDTADNTPAPATSGDKITVGMSIPQMANPYFISVMNGVQARCDELGWDLTVVDAGYDVAKQVSDFENFGNQGVNAVIACPIDSNALLPVTEQLKEKGTIVVSFAQVIDNANAILTLDEYEYGVIIGTNAAKWINEQLGGEAEVLIISQDNVEAVVQRGNGIQDTIEKLTNATVVARQAGDNPEKGMEIAENILQQYPNLKVITGNNDAGPLGAYEAVKAMGKNTDDFYVGGGDATPEAIEKMKEDGSVYRATVDLGPPYQTGLDAVNTIKDFLDNGIPDEAPVSLFGFEPVWQEDVLAGWTPMG